tara:strand:- start:332 stop:556 length:225 start_codon:yes stop_codon:yes gene_type:complete
MDQEEFYYSEQLMKMFRVGTTPKLMQVLEEAGIGYLVDGDRKPFVFRSVIRDLLENNSGGNYENIRKQVHNIDR